MTIEGGQGTRRSMKVFNCQLFIVNCQETKYGDIFS